LPPNWLYRLSLWPIKMARAKAKVKAALLRATSGDTIIVHMNHPEADTRVGVMDAVPELKRQGFRFVRLSERPLR
jgi:hypothetical protein